MIRPRRTRRLLFLIAVPVILLVRTIWTGHERLRSSDAAFLDASINEASLRPILWTPDSSLANNSTTVKSTAAAGMAISNVTALNKTFAACLLFMDDNHKLSEWLGYHYYVLGGDLRTVIVAVDPQSTESPRTVLELWRQHGLLDYSIWNDTDFAYNLLKLQPQPTDGPKRKLHKHRQRQGQFYVRCIRHLKQQAKQANQTSRWTLFVDSDEYLVWNPDVVDDAATRMAQPGSIGHAILKYTGNAREFPPSHQLDWYAHFQQSHCVTLPRTLVSAAVDELDGETVESQPWLVPNERQLVTRRYVYRAMNESLTILPSLGKSIVDVSRLKPYGDFRAGYEIHRPLPATCPPHVHWNDLPIGIYQYVFLSLV